MCSSVLLMYTWPTEPLPVNQNLMGVSNLQFGGEFNVNIRVQPSP
jgi:hypothetical protein